MSNPNITTHVRRSCDRQGCETTAEYIDTDAALVAAGWLSLPSGQQHLCPGCAEAPDGALKAVESSSP